MLLNKEYYKDNDGMIWQEPDDPNETIWRFKGNPILDTTKFKNFWHVYNSSVVMMDGKYVGVFRCDSREGKPDLHVGWSNDGVNFDIEEEAIVAYEVDGKPFVYEYSYDPRIIKLEGSYYIVFCADVDGPSIYIFKTDDFKRFDKIPNGFLPFNRNGVLFPERINGKYVMLSRPSDAGDTPFGNIHISESPDLIHWGNHRLVMKNFYNKSYWERIKIGAGPVPIKTEEGWILLYHGVQHTCNAFTYSVGVAVLDLEDPSKVKYRATRYLLTPEELYEMIGFSGYTIFPCSALVDSEGKVAIYYGAADSNMGIAFTTVEKLLKFAKDYSVK